jgi:hypothetical protein
MSFFQNGGQEGKTDPLWGLTPVGRGERIINKGCRRVNMFSCMKMER